MQREGKAVVRGTSLCRMVALLSHSSEAMFGVALVAPLATAEGDNQPTEAASEGGNQLTEAGMDEGEEGDEQTEEAPYPSPSPSPNPNPSPSRSPNPNPKVEFDGCNSP